jgi:excisionase family DNA binding protein
MFTEGKETMTSSTAEQSGLHPKWYTTKQVAVMLGYSLTKTKHLVLSGQIRSIKDGGNRRILPQYVDEYVARKAQEASS